MAFYDYHCDANNQTVEVQHSVNDKLHTWKELCDCAGIKRGNTAPESPVRRLINGGAIAGVKTNNAFTPARSRKDAGHICGPNCSH